MKLKALLVLTLSVVVLMLAATALAQSLPAPPAPAPVWSFWPWLDRNYLPLGAVITALGTLAGSVGSLFPAGSAPGRLFAALAAGCVNLVGVLKAIVGGGGTAAKRGFAGLEIIFGTLAVAVTGMVLMALAAFLSGCAADPAVVLVTPANQAAVSSCQGIEAARGDIVIGDFTFTGAAAVLGGIAAGLPASNVNGRTDFALAAAGSAGVAGVLTGLTAFETSAFTNGQCQQYLGPLPASPFGNKTTVTVTPTAGQ